MKIKKWLISLVAVIGLCGLNTISIHASSYMSYNLNHAKYHRSMRYVTKPIKIEKLNNSSVFAYIKKTGSHQLYIGQRIGINQFYHMGNDGFVVYIPHHNKTIYYAPTNSHKWFGSKYQAKRAKRTHQRAIKRAKYNKRINNIKKVVKQINSYVSNINSIYNETKNQPNFSISDYNNEKRMAKSDKVKLTDSIRTYRNLAFHSKTQYDHLITVIFPKYNNIINDINSDVNISNKISSINDEIDFEENNNIPDLENKLSNDEEQDSINASNLNDEFPDLNNNSYMDDSTSNNPITNIEEEYERNNIKKHQQNIVNDKQEIVDAQNKLNTLKSQLTNM